MAETSRPTSVTAAFALWIIAAVFALLVGFVGFITLTGAARGLGGADTSLLVLLALASLATGIVELVVVLQMRKGRNWARIVLTVLGVISVAVGAYDLSRGDLISITGIVLSALAVLLMYVGGANAFFRSTRRGA